jgi:hypothetical protein
MSVLGSVWLSYKFWLLRLDRFTQEYKQLLNADTRRHDYHFRLKETALEVERCRMHIEDIEDELISEAIFDW